MNTYNQDQLNTAVASASDEVMKLLHEKINRDLTIKNLRDRLKAMTEENEKLKKENESLKLKEEKPSDNDKGHIRRSGKVHK